MSDGHIALYFPVCLLPLAQFRCGATLFSLFKSLLITLRPTLIMYILTTFYLKFEKSKIKPSLKCLHGLIPIFSNVAFSHLPSSYLHKLKHSLFHKYITQFPMAEYFFHALLSKSIPFIGIFCDEGHILYLYH